jgi:hypothetical protein
MLLPPPFYLGDDGDEKPRPPRHIEDPLQGPVEVGGAAVAMIALIGLAIWIGRHLS